MRTRLNHRALATAIAATVGLGAPSAAVADGDGMPLPAVSGLNGKVAARGGAADGKGLVFGDLSLTVPLLHSFGAQADATVGHIGKHTVWGTSGHLFWRNPALGLVGLTGLYAEINDSRHTHIVRAGGEVEGYMGDILGVGGDLTIRAGGGWQGGEKRPGAAGTGGGGSRRGGYANLTLGFYPIDDLVLKLGGAVASGPKNNVGTIGAEYQPVPTAYPGLTVFVTGSVGENKHEGVLAGLRYYFGSRPKSLKRRHREDDPSSLQSLAIFEGVDFPEIEDNQQLQLCWVAREVYGIDNPDWLRFRSWLLTKAPSWFRTIYIAHGERFARWISDKPRLKSLIRAWMDDRLRTAPQV